MFRQIGGGEILLLIVVLLLVFGLFGAKRLPDAARGVGRSLRIFKSEVREMRNDDERRDGEKTGSSAPTSSASTTSTTAELPPAAPAGTGQAPRVPEPERRDA